MNTKLMTLGISTMLALASCGGTESQDSSLRQTFTTQLLADTTTVTPTTDIIISNFSSKSTSNHHNSFEIQVIDNGNNEIDTDQLSFALEYSTTPRFDTVYRTALFDLQTTQRSGNSVTVTARAKPAELPTGLYTARLVVNPDWRTYLENNVQTHDLSQPLHYINEANNTNNSSGSFDVQINTDIQCTEDIYENNNTLEKATLLKSKATLTASLCKDNVDFYALPLQANQTSVLSLVYDENHATPPSQYTIISDDFYREETGVLEAPESQIQFTAAVSGTYYLAIFGTRANYTISRDQHTALATDWFFSTDSVAGPTSPVYGPITLSRLKFNTADLLNKTAHCRMQVIDPLNPASYTTPPHFPGIHEFRFLDNNSYLMDGATRYQWGVETGDITNDDWYDNSYHGWAENLYDGSWRYWDFNGESYVQCALK